MNKLQQAKIILEKYNQTKVLSIMEFLNDEQKEKLAEQILNINMEEIFNLYSNRNEKAKFQQNIQPIDAIDKKQLTDKQKQELAAIGEDVIKNNHYAVVTMAGGQGTRLGFNGPKGTFKLSNGKYIFEILVDTLKSAAEKYKNEVYWYIMTSEENNEQTISFLEEHNYFGYDKDKIKFFKQGVLPLVDKQGNLLINKHFQIKEASNGNGGIFKALKNSGMIEDMKKKNIEWISICGVDNIMAKMVDPIFLGLLIKENMCSGSKSIKKSFPEEKVGIFCKRNNRPGIIEYSDMTEDMIYAKKENDELIYAESNIVNHLFNMESLEKMAECELIYHCAEKKNSYVDEDLQEVIPNTVNSYKFESFIFDSFECLDNMLILRVEREAEFAPIKNEKGVDSPETAVKIYEVRNENK